MTCYLKAVAMERPGSPGLRPIQSTVPQLEADDPGALTAAAAGKPVLAGCLRNAEAVARAARSLGDVVTVIAAGERWFMTDDSLRPAFEDQVGAGAILAHLNDRSPEAQGAVAVFQDARGDLLNRLMNSSSGREVSARGYDDDVQMAGEIEVSTTVPILRDGAFGV